MSGRRPQCRHGTNYDGAARSPLGEIVWAVDFTERKEPRPIRTECEDVELAKKRAGLKEPKP